MTFVSQESGEYCAVPITRAEYDDLLSRMRAADGDDDIAFQTLVAWLTLSREPAPGSA